MFVIQTCVFCDLVVIAVSMIPIEVDAATAVVRTVVVLKCIIIGMFQVYPVYVFYAYVVGDGAVFGTVEVYANFVVLAVVVLECAVAGVGVDAISVVRGAYIVGEGAM